MTAALEAFNTLDEAAAEQWLEACCAAPAWARDVAAARPFDSLEALIDEARTRWATSSEKERLEAFKAHPLIGDVELLRARFGQSGDRANAEQGQVLGADNAVLEALASLNRTYLDRHGFIFIVFASGKTAEEMLKLLQARLPRSRDEELAAAAAEQMKITELRIQQRLAAHSEPV